MGDQFSVQLDALSHYAAVADGIAGDMTDARRALVDADVTGDSFGMLPQSRDTHGVYERRCTDGLDVLDAGHEVFTALAEAFRGIRDGYDRSDRSSAARSAAAYE